MDRSHVVRELTSRVQVTLNPGLGQRRYQTAKSHREPKEYTTTIRDKLNNNNIVDRQKLDPETAKLDSQAATDMWGPGNGRSLDGSMIEPIHD